MVSSSQQHGKWYAMTYVLPFFIQCDICLPLTSIMRFIISIYLINVHQALRLSVLSFCVYLSVYQVFSLTLDSSVVCQRAFSVMTIWWLRFPMFESCFQQRKTTWLLSIKKRLLLPEHQNKQKTCVHACMSINRSMFMSIARSMFDPHRGWAIVCLFKIRLFQEHTYVVEMGAVACARLAFHISFHKQIYLPTYL